MELAKAVISLLPSPRSLLLFLLLLLLLLLLFGPPRMRYAAAGPGGNVRHAAAPLLFPHPVGIRTVTSPHTSAPPPAPNQSTKVLPNPRLSLYAFSRNATSATWRRPEQLPPCSPLLTNLVAE